jgi:serine/threonine-protein kinase
MIDSPARDFLALQEALVGRYSLVRELGRGGMGLVYLAHEVRLDRPVALKVLPREYSGQPSSRERFLREARTAAKLSHPHIVPIHAVDEAGEFVYFAMAYVEGQTLGQRVRERGPVPPREAARILREVAWALGYAHAQGVVHRDVKPDNILIEGGTGRALVTDFGIAQVAGGSALAASHEILGTAEFMSPEQASGGSIDAMSDMYSLGVVAHYMLSGRLPLEGATVAATLAKHITQAAPPLATVAPEVPRRLSDAVDRCLAKDPSERSGGAEAFAEGMSLILEERREVPVAIRNFVKKNLESTSSIGALWIMAMIVAASMIAATATGDPPALLMALMRIFLVVFTVTPIWLLGGMARQLLTAGYGYDDLVRALESDVARRREELASEYGTGVSRLDRWANRLVGGGLAVLVAALARAFGPGTSLPVVDTILAALITPALFAAVGAGLFSAVRYELRRHVPEERWLQFWESLPGRWIFKLAGVGLRRGPAGDAYRPTELAIGMAADRLFEDLPPDVRSSFAEIPEVLRALESHAEQIRARIDELDASLRDLEPVPRADEEGAAHPARAFQRRESLADELQRARDAAEQRRGEVVTALESIRLELLRLHAGVGSVEGMTADLGSARDLAADLERLVEAGRVVDDVVRVGRPRRSGDTPPPGVAPATI